MATEINEFSISRPSAEQTKYPWDKWQNGKVWRIVRWVDYTRTTASMASTIRSRAIAKCMKVRCRLDHAKEVIEFQFFPRPDAIEPSKGRKSR